MHLHIFRRVRKIAKSDYYVKLQTFAVVHNVETVFFMGD